MRIAEELRCLVLAANSEGRRQLAKRLRALGLSPSQAEVLRVLADHAPLSLSGLGSLLVCESGSSPSRLVDRTVASGLVRRRRGSTDGREIELTLTPEGERLSREVAAIEDGMYASFDAITSEDVAATRELLWRFVAESPSGQALARRIALAETIRPALDRGSRSPVSATKPTSSPEHARHRPSLLRAHLERGRPRPS